MSFSLKLTHFARAKALGQASLQQVSSGSQILYPAETVSSKEAIYLPRDLDRVQNVMEDTTFALEKQRIDGGKRAHGATVLYTLEHVELSAGYLFKERYKERLVQRMAHEAGPRCNYDEASLTGTFFGSFYFGHFMTDDLMLNLLGEEFGSCITPKRKLYSHELGYRERLSLFAAGVDRSHIGKLRVFNDLGQNSYKRARYQVIRNRLRDRIEPAGNQRVILHRGGVGNGRFLTNEAEVELYLSGRGFVLIDPVQLTVTEVVRQLMGAEIVIGVEGSQLVHALYTMAEGGVLCTLQPPNRFNNCYKDHTDCIGLRYSFLTCLPAEGGFRIDLDEVGDWLDRVERAIR